MAVPGKLYTGSNLSLAFYFDLHEDFAKISRQDCRLKKAIAVSSRCIANCQLFFLPFPAISGSGMTFKHNEIANVHL